MKKPQLTVLLLTLLLVGAAGGQAWAGIRPYALTVSPFVGKYLFEGNQNLKNRGVYGLAVGYNFSENWAAEVVAAHVDTITTSGPRADVDAYIGRLDLLYHFRPDRLFVPYLAAGVGGIFFDADGDLLDGEDDEDGLANYGVGFKYFFSESAALRGDVRHILDINLRDDDRKHDLVNNLSATVGIFMQFGGGEPAPAAVVMPSDADGDGVVDDFDRCPDTTLGVPVDGFGCPLDSDRDGVIDAADRCPDTLAGVTVDQYGCPQSTISDTDRDGVEDARDKCPNSLAGMAVNENGCPRDSDGDRVFDFEDRCPGTPRGTPVGPDGCPLPVAPKPAPVSAPAPAAAPASMTLQLEFASGQAVVLSEFDRELKAAADFIKAHPGSRIRIEGHTDNVGSEASNLKLSQQRADNVRLRLVEALGIPADRIEARGYGELLPVADNTTPEGRRKNRRVVITAAP